MRTLPFGVLILAAALAAIAQNPPPKQDSTQKKDAPAKEEPAPLFGGKLGVRSSEKTKESATLGFNGIDPSGKVDEKMLSTNPTAEHQAKAKQMAALSPNPDQLNAFIAAGRLVKK